MKNDGELSLRFAFVSVEIKSLPKNSRFNHGRFAYEGGLRLVGFPIDSLTESSPARVTEIDRDDYIVGLAFTGHSRCHAR